jgi:hypothetical protein
MESVSAPDVEDPRIRGHPAAIPQQPAGLEPGANPMNQAKLPSGKIQGVILGRVDPLELGDIRPRIQIEQAATPAAHDVEGVRAGIVFEVGAGADLGGRPRAAHAALARHQPERVRPGTGPASGLNRE